MAKEGVDPVSRLVVGFLRLFSDKKQADFADASGVYQPDVSKYESGDKAPTEKTLRRLAAAAGVPWFAVPHLRRFFDGLIDAARGGSGVQPGEEKGIERAILEPAFLAVAAYRIEDEAAEVIPHQAPEELVCEAEQTWDALERFPVGGRRRVAEWLRLGAGVGLWPCGRARRA
jgi:transcriptional regulator with XRE-family HTH domain